MTSETPPVLPQTPWTWLRTVLNWLNLSTVLGLVIANLGGARVTPIGRGTLLATGYRHGFPGANAFTVGSVITSKHALAYFADRPALLRHEDRHCTQYAWVLGVVMLPCYLLCAGISWVLAGDRSSFNPFERLANLSDGNYPPPTTRRRRRR